MCIEIAFSYYFQGSEATDQTENLFVPGNETNREMPTTSSLKSNRTREKKILLKEESETQKILRTEFTGDSTEIGRHLLVIGKVLLNLETKLSRLEIANDKLIEAYEQNNDNEGAEQFQSVLDEESEIIDGIIDKVSKLKVLRGELEQRRRESDRRHTGTTDQVRQTQQTGDVASGLSPQTYGPIKPPQLEITPFCGDVLKWKEFWDAFEASIDKVKYAPIDKLNYLKV